MHIAEGILSGPVLVGAAVLSAAGVAEGLRRIDYEDTHRTGLMAAVFFMVSMISVPIGPTSAHLILNGLMGLLLGWAALPALAAALLLQSVFLGYGGFTALGANVLIMGLPALIVSMVFRGFVTRSTTPSQVFGWGCGAGAVSILLTYLCAAAVLLASGKEFQGVAAWVVAVHLPLLIIESYVTGAALYYFKKNRPEWLTASMPPPERKE